MYWVRRKFRMALFSWSSNMGSSPSFLTTPLSKVQSCWWIKPPISFCLLQDCSPSPSSSFFSCLQARSELLTWASLVRGNEPYQPMLVVYMWLKGTNAKSWELPGTFQGAVLTSPPQFLSLPVQCMFLKNPGQICLGKVKQMQWKDIPKSNSNDICSLHFEAPFQWRRAELALPSFPF